MGINFCDFFSFICPHDTSQPLRTHVRMDNDDIYDFNDDHEKLMTLLSNKWFFNLDDTCIIWIQNN